MKTTELMNGLSLILSGSDAYNNESLNYTCSTYQYFSQKLCLIWQR